MCGIAGIVGSDDAEYEKAVHKMFAAMEKCVLCLGNDMGAMYMAVAAGLKCVAIFSSIDYPRKSAKRTKIIMQNF